MIYNYYATCPDHLTAILAAELRELGAEDIREDYRVVYFSGSQDLLYKANLYLRTASRVFLVLKEIPAKTPTIIYDKAKRIQYHKFFGAEQALSITINAAAAKGGIESHLIGSKLREAVTNSFQHFAGKAANLSSYDAKVHLVGFYHRDRLMISLDTSLQSLHKRGYRTEGHLAPIKETLAAALLRVMGYDGTQDFCDPMCGSGTIVIEAAQMAMKKAAQIHRSKGSFGFEYFAGFDNAKWREIQDEARRNQHPPTVQLVGRDISDTYLEVAKKSALAARVEKYLTLETKDFFAAEKPSDQGVMIANLPYGLRLDEDLTPEYLRSIGDQLKQKWKGWRCGLLLPTAAPYKEVGLKTSKRLDFLNGSVPVKFLVFDIF